MPLPANTLNVPVVTGVAQVCVGTGQSGALESLGYTRNGANVTREAFWTDIPGDQNGGDDGPPVDIQYMGEIARVRVELTKFDPLIEAKVAARVNGATAGTPAAAGTLMFGGAKYMRLCIATSSFPINFPQAIPRMPIEINKGTKFSTLVCEFECHKDSTGVLYNSTTS